MSETTLATYGFEEDAMGLAHFINQSIKGFIDGDDAPVVYVYGSDGEMIDSADFTEETLTDGSKVYNLRLS